MAGYIMLLILLIGAVVILLIAFRLQANDNKTVTRERDEARRDVRKWEERACDNAIARDELQTQMYDLRDKRDQELGCAYEHGQHNGVDWARGIASRALSPKHYWRLEAAIERAVARAEDRVDNVDVAAVLKRHRRHVVRDHAGDTE